MDHARRDQLATAAWMAVLLVAADLALGVAFRMPRDPAKPPAPLAQYFDFGASIESKARRMVGDREANTAPVALAGWIEPVPAAPARVPGRLDVAVYGQSFTFQVTGPMAEMDPGLAVRTRGGPASPPSHGFALWEADRRVAPADVAILGVLASSVRGVDAMTAATWQFESPPLYTYPRYRVDASGALAASEPLVRSLDGLREVLRDPARRRAWEAQLARDDAWYDPLTWRASWLDRSTFAKLLRRAWAQRNQRLRLARVHDRRGFREDAGSVRVLRALTGAFVDGCRRDGTLPVVLLLDDAGYADHLSKLLGPELERRGAVWLGTHELADASDRANLRGDGHFVPEVNRRLAAALLARVRAGLNEAGTAAAPAPAAPAGPGGAPGEVPGGGAK